MSPQADSECYFRDCPLRCLRFSCSLRRWASIAERDTDLVASSHRFLLRSSRAPMRGSELVLFLFLPAVLHFAKQAGKQTNREASPGHRVPRWAESPSEKFTALEHRLPLAETPRSSPCMGGGVGEREGARVPGEVLLLIVHRENDTRVPDPHAS